MRRWWLKRVGQLLIVIWALGTLVFFLNALLPGDPVTLMLGENALPGEVERVRHDLGLDRPILERYVRFWSHTLIGDFGTSVFTREPIRIELARRLRATALLAVASLSLALVIGLPVGWFAARRAGSFKDRVLTGLATLGVAIPSFWLAPLLMLLFSIRLGWLPVSGYGSLRHLVLPAVTLAAGLTAYLARISRAAFLQTLRQPFVTAARARGLPSHRILLFYIFKPSAIPIVTVAGLQLGALLTGTVITETIFAWPGVGRYLIEGIYARDYPVVQACVLVFGVIYALTNLLVDALYTYLDPRTRTLMEQFQ